MATPKETSIHVGDQRARLLQRGDGYPVVVLHGWGGRIESMMPVIDCLSSSFHVLAFDLPGFGDAPLPTTVWGTPEYATFIRSALGDLGIDKAHFVGHSFGAKTSLYISATHPAIVDKLVLQASSGLRTPPSAKARLKRKVSRAARAAGRLGPPGQRVRDAVYRRIQSDDYREAGRLRPILVKVVNEDLADLLPRVQASTLLIWGDRDEAVPLQHAHRMEREIPDAGLVLFENAGHFAYLDQRDRFCLVVKHFLGGGQ